MQLELPSDLCDRVQQLAVGSGGSAADVIRKALDALDDREREQQAIQEGIDAWKQGDVQDFDEFDREFRAKNGLPARS